MHSGFRLPMNIFSDSTSSIRVPLTVSHIITNASFVIIGEASSMNIAVLKIIDRLIGELIENDKYYLVVK